MSKDTHRVRLSSLTVQVLLHPSLILQARIEVVEQQGRLRAPVSHLIRESKLKTVDDLPQGEICVCQRLAYKIFAFARCLIVFEHTLEVAEELG